MKTYKELHVWEKSVELVTSIYTATRRFPEDEKFGLISQMRRCAVSIPSNIAEGHGRKSNVEFARYLRISYGSSSELETQLIISKKLNFLSDKDFDKINSELTEVRKMLNKLISTVLKASD